MASAKATIDHDEIRSWVESRGGFPAHVKRTESGGNDPGVLRIDYPGFSGQESLERIDWDQWFEWFDRDNLAFLFQAEGRSRFSKLVDRNTVDVSAASSRSGRRTATKRSSSAKRSAGSKRSSASKRSAGSKRASASKRSAASKRSSAKGAAGSKRSSSKRAAATKRSASSNRGTSARKSASTKRAASKSSSKRSASKSPAKRSTKSARPSRSTATKKRSTASRTGNGHATARRSTKSRSTKSASGRTSRSARTTTDHDEIQSWVEQRGGYPARVKRSGRKNDPGILRIDYPGFTGAKSLERIGWDEWFNWFDRDKLAFLYQNVKNSRFSKLVRR